MGLFTHKARRRASDYAVPFERSIHFGRSGWAPRPAGQHPSDQNGYYGDAILSTYPARWEGAQLFSGVGALFPGWSVAVGLAPGGPPFPLWQTQRPTNVPGAQRWGGNAGPLAPAGPIASRQMRQSVLQAQIRQSGTGIMSWAQQLAAWG